MKLIVGLGNPGIEYENTRHNTGFMAIDKYASTNNLVFNKNKFDGLYTDFIFNGEKIILLKPQKFMNLSGEVISKFLKYFKIDIQDLLVIYDDMDLDVGNFKIRYKGGSAGHNGLKNIESNILTDEYKRIKIGISKNKNIDTVNYVLGKFSPEEHEKLNSVLEKIPDIINDYLKINFDNLMNKYN